MSQWQKMSCLLWYMPHVKHDKTRNILTNNNRLLTSCMILLWWLWPTEDITSYRIMNIFITCSVNSLTCEMVYGIWCIYTHNEITIVMIWKLISGLLKHWPRQWKVISKTPWVDISVKFLDALLDMDKIYDQKLLQQHQIIYRIVSHY